MSDCIEIFEETLSDDKRTYMHVHNKPVQIWVNDRLIYESPKESV